ncbi:MAG: BadF/BadG/BcrA/BcrD ATPase family protein [Mesotoga sp.]|jgi:N-acetylglucosamine kinase-like BadF-type ATPase|uniref:BadF/BadG/BcrA/BcrD ATPase family protein n=1 Tax=Mesotoga sp. TaxID=2053577 RepID=UPI0016AC9997|nr:BadF/BadG/BcrA/BcrD ATPase family protein [Mesotoga sp.]MDI9368155.1 BadF/BadG/BcrA/BcrD ATPase family protein [Thermotogota bacterium]NLT45217.1 ATPase [Thermotogaceae bacterium]MDD2333131.1 BadF/BadG/BcrA/BcrD ATPase family protein [Mesotoga sp.]MDD3680732.1 BadF/BadG/BcrA/BcrD ATPase family protein [Mesotoga sp.]MDD4208140.1 BadF/BadG/BcrA/BcrD ATPase family protein [Mesotoga sp.]
MSKKILAMDGGGTTLRVTAISSEGKKRKSYATGVNITAVSSSNLISIFSLVRDDIWVPDVILAAFSGAGDRIREGKLRQALESVFRDSEIEVIMDIEGLYRAAVGEERGVVVVSGTGSTVYGHDCAGVAVKSGGWGHIFDDEGSAYWISKELITASLKYRDELIPHDPVFDQLVDFFETDNIEELVNLTLLPDMKTKIASFSKVALEDPSELVKIVADKGIGILAKRTLRVLERTGEVDTIHTFGGSFASAYYNERFSEMINNHRTSFFTGNVDEILAEQMFEKLNRS